RERPAFNVGDVVFGKVTDVTEDALFVDLSGKARAIFDLRELRITDEDVEEYTKADKKEADELAAARAANPLESSSSDIASLDTSVSGETGVVSASVPEATESAPVAAPASEPAPRGEPEMSDAAPPTQPSQPMVAAAQAEPIVTDAHAEEAAAAP